MPEWDSEIEIGEDLARSLIREQFPQLDATALRRLGEGWDNTVWVTSENIAFRFPRRAIALPGVQREIAVLPELASRLPVPIPDAAYPGAPTARFPWPWFGSRLIEGTEIALAQPDDRQRDQLAHDLGVFLRSLHQLQPPSIDELECDPLGRADMSARVPRTRAALEHVAPLCDLRDLADPILSAAETLPPDDEHVLAHGDLNLRHALISGAGRLAGVIDWGDMCRAPRSIDLPLYWSLFEPDARATFQAAYGHLTYATLARGRVLALFFDATLAVYADDKGMQHLKRAALQGLKRSVTD